MQKQSKMELVKIKISDVLIPVNYPRMDEIKDDALSKSISEHGQIDPIVLDSKGFLIAGLRRLTAMKEKKYRNIWAIKFVDVKNSNERYLISVIESLKRKDLNPIEKAKAFKSLREMLNVTTRRLANILRISRTSIDYHIKLLELPEETKENLISGKIKPYELENLLYRHRIKTHEQFKLSTDEAKFNSVISRLACFKSDIAYGVYNKEHLLSIKTHVEEILKILEERLQKLEPKE